MSAFEIVQENPVNYSEQILSYWQTYLKDTPSGRLEWMQEGNPAGPARWLFAREKKTGDLAGIISIMPKQLYHNGKELRAGILGDFIVADKYRVFGPALQLQKEVATSLSAFGFDFLYTLPNPASKKMTQRAGFVEAFTLNYLVKPLRLEHYLKKYISPSSARFVGNIFNPILKLLSMETYIKGEACCVVVDKAGPDFDRLNDRLKNIPDCFYGDRSSAFLNWRYLMNPLHSFRIVTVRAEKNGELLGYIVFTINENKAEIFDIVSISSSDGEIALKKLVQLCRRDGCHAIYARLSSGNPWRERLKRFMFMDSKGDEHLHAIWDKDVKAVPVDKWNFFEGDRNV